MNFIYGIKSTMSEFVTLQYFINLTYLINTIIIYVIIYEFYINWSN